MDAPDAGAAPAAVPKLLAAAVPAAEAFKNLLRLDFDGMSSSFEFRGRVQPIWYTTGFCEHHLTGLCNPRCKAGSNIAARTGAVRSLTGPTGVHLPFVLTRVTRAVLPPEQS